MATHAFAVDYAGDINLPSMLTIENDNLDIITANKVTSFELENSIALLSACDTAAGYRPNRFIFDWVRGSFCKRWFKIYNGLSLAN